MYLCNRERDNEETYRFMGSAGCLCAAAAHFVAAHPRDSGCRRADVRGVCAPPVPRPSLAALRRDAPVRAVSDSHPDLCSRRCRCVVVLLLQTRSRLCPLLSDTQPDAGRLHQPSWSSIYVRGQEGKSPLI